MKTFEVGKCYLNIESNRFIRCVKTSEKFAWFEIEDARVRTKKNIIAMFDTEMCHTPTKYGSVLVYASDVMA